MEGEDMMATPIGKLPPPVIQQRPPNQQVENTNYADLLKEQFSPPPSTPNFQQPLQQAPSQLAPPPSPLTPPPSLHIMQQQPLLSAPPPPSHYSMQYNPMPPQPAFHTPLPPLAPLEPRASLIESLTTDKMPWVTAAIIFAVLTYGIPKLQHSFPNLMINATTGGASLIGTIGVALVTALILHVIQYQWYHR